MRDKLSKIPLNAHQLPGGAGFAKSNVQQDAIQALISLGIQKAIAEKKIKEELGKNRVPIVMPSIMFDRKILQTVKGYPENLARGEDLVFIKAIVANHHSVMNIHEVLYAYRRKPLQNFSGYLEDVVARGVHNFLPIRYLLHIWKRVFFIIIGISASIKWWGIEEKLNKFLIETRDL